ncbi:DegT/DnrJ/EryC1/StrS family aminotransferase [Candidatus Riflebacteria bacterium]
MVKISIKTGQWEKTMLTPGILSGKPNFPDFIPLTFPNLPDLSELQQSFQEILQTGMITNGSYVKKLENAIKSKLKVRHVLAVNTCTSGLILVLKALKLKGEVIIPSFTFCATLHSLNWNQLTPVFVDIEQKTLNLDPKRVEMAINKKTAAILGLHIYGNPCAVNKLTKIAKKYEIPLIFDAAHALGAKVGNTFIGNFGTAEIFSLSPTKCITSGEGGIIATNNTKLYEKVKVLRNYGDPGDYNCIDVGINARMSEFHAIVGLKSYKRLQGEIRFRQQYNEIMLKVLHKIPGIAFPKIEAKNLCNFKDFTMIIDEKKFGLNRDQLALCLRKDNVDSRFYFFPPQHQQKAYPRLGRSFKNKLPITDKISRKVISLPIYKKMTLYKVKILAMLISSIYKNSHIIKKKLDE